MADTVSTPASAAESVVQSVDTFQARQPQGQIRRTDIKRMLASLAVHSPADPVAFLDELVGDPQRNERRPVWASNDSFELRLSTSSAEAGGWTGKMPAYFPPSAAAPRPRTVLDSRARKVRAFADDTDTRVQARLKRMVDETERLASAHHQLGHNPGDAGFDPPPAEEKQQVTGVQVSVSAVSLEPAGGSGGTGLVIHADEDWKAQIATTASAVIDQLIDQALSSLSLGAATVNEGEEEQEEVETAAAAAEAAT